MLYTQIADIATKKMKKTKSANLLQYLTGDPLTENAAGYFSKFLDFVPGDLLPQRKLVDLGKIISRVISAGYVVTMAARGFRKDLIDGCLEHLRMDIAMLASKLHLDSRALVIEDYVADSDWRSFV